jgi:hypothetical protein
MLTIPAAPGLSRKSLCWGGARDSMRAGSPGSGYKNGSVTTLSYFCRSRSGQQEGKTGRPARTATISAPGYHTAAALAWAPVSGGRLTAPPTPPSGPLLALSVSSATQFRLHLTSTVFLVSSSGTQRALQGHGHKADILKRAFVCCSQGLGNVTSPS